MKRVGVKLLHQHSLTVSENVIQRWIFFLSNIPQCYMTTFQFYFNYKSAFYEQ